MENENSPRHPYSFFLLLSVHVSIIIFNFIVQLES